MFYIKPLHYYNRNAHVFCHCLLIYYDLIWLRMVGYHFSASFGYEWYDVPLKGLLLRTTWPKCCVWYDVLWKGLLGLF